MIVEGLRTDSLYIFDLRVSQLLAGITVIVGTVLLIAFRKRTEKAVDRENKTETGETNGTERLDNKNT